MGSYLTGESVPTEKRCFTVKIPDDLYLVSAFLGQMEDLLNDYSWQKFGSLTEQECAEEFNIIFEETSESENNCMIGSVSVWATEQDPVGYLFCDGATYQKDDYPELWEVLPSQMKTATTFDVPDMRTRTPRGASTVSQVNTTGGNSSVTLTEGNLPPHRHNYSTNGLAPTLDGEIPTLSYNNPIQLQTGSVGNAVPFSILPPYTFLRYFIKAL